MAYTRGEPYIWSDGDFLHLWTETGGEDVSELSTYAGMAEAGGVKIAESVMDQFAVMRFAELLKLGLLPEVIRTTLTAHGQNFGGAALTEVAELLGGLGPSDDPGPP